ncbi:hypothetical protein Holit_02625 [Hollandina sp. SP2]
MMPEGVEAAQDLGGLRDVKFNYIISSDLVRARQTARLVMDQNRVSKNYRVEDREMLRAACYGQFEGDVNNSMLAAVMEALGISVQECMNDAYRWVTPADSINGGFDKKTGRQRHGRRCRDHQSPDADKLKRGRPKPGKEARPCPLVAQGMSINSRLSGIDPSFEYTGESLENAAVCKVLYRDGKVTVQSFNDTRYIDAGKTRR